MGLGFGHQKLYKFGELHLILFSVKFEKQRTEGTAFLNVGFFKKTFEIIGVEVGFSFLSDMFE